MADLRRTFLGLIVPLFVIVAPSGSTRGSTVSGEGRIVVYLEVPAHSQETIILEVGGLSLETPGGDRLGIVPVIDRVESRAIAGRQALFVDQPVPAGRYETLRIDYERLRGVIEGATVSLDSPEAGTHVALGLEVEPRSAALVILRWNPHAIDPDVPSYEPAIDAVRADRPPPAGRLYVTNEGSNTVIGFDRFNHRVVDAIMVSGSPRGAAYAWTDERLLVACVEEDAIAVVDLLSGGVPRMVPMRYGDRPTRMVAAANGRDVFVLNAGTDQVAALSSASLQETGRSTVGEKARDLAIGLDGTTVYASGEMSGDLSVLDRVGTGAGRRIPVATAPGEIALGGEGEMYVAGAGRAEILLIDPRDGRQLRRWDACAPVTGLAYADRSRLLYAAVGDCKTVSVFRPELGLEIATIPLPAGPGRIQIDPDERRIYATLPDRDAVAVISTSTHKITAILDTGTRPHSVVVPDAR